MTTKGHRAGERTSRVGTEELQGLPLLGTGFI